jgi:hypothetical protein
MPVRTANRPGRLTSSTIPRPNPSQAAVPGCAEYASSATTSCAGGAVAHDREQVVIGEPPGRGRDAERGVDLRAPGQRGQLDRGQLDRTRTAPAAAASTSHASAPGLSARNAVSAALVGRGVGGRGAPDGSWGWPG